MKLSEIQGERAIEVIADLVEPIADIAMDKGLKDVFKVKVGDGETAEEAAARTIKAKVPYMLKTHKKQIAQILGVLENVDPKSLNILQIVKGITEMLNDKALIQLFSSAVLTEEEAPLTEDCNK